MFVVAGKTWSSRYDKKAPIHLARGDETGPQSLCAGMEVAPIKDPRVTVTCSTCSDLAVQLSALSKTG